MTEQASAKSQAWLGWSRIAIGLGQGLALYALSEVREAEVWPATAPELFAALSLIALFVPLILIGGLGALRRITVLIWTLAAALMLGGLGWYDVARGALEDSQWFSLGAFFASAAIVFVAHHLIAAGDESRRLIAPYERYFDLGWRHGAQLALAGLFTGAFWAVLHLGSALFQLIGIDVLRDLIAEAWFGIPATTMMFAAAIHLTDLRSGLVRGFRALGLVLLSWLAPIMTGLAAAFLLALPFTGLQPLWDTRAATAMLLGACVVLVILINAAYQDGAPEHAPGRILRWAVRTASVILTPLAALAAYALFLRIAQYGLTPERIYAAAVLAIGACYALAYLAGAFWPRWMKPLEAGNIASAFVVLAVALALFSPIADPARISVADQVRRLESGKVAPADFDYAFLRFDGARYGRAALERMRADRADARTREIAEQAVRALAWESRWDGDAQPARREPASPASAFTMHPAGARFPDGFIEHALTQPTGQLSLCHDGHVRCHAFFLDLNHDGDHEIVIASVHFIIAFDNGAEGGWNYLGQAPVYGWDNTAALERGDVRVVAPRVSDLEIGGMRYQLNIVVDSPAEATAPETGAGDRWINEN